MREALEKGGANAHVAVIGVGNVAIDCARVLLKDAGRTGRDGYLRAARVGDVTGASSVVRVVDRSTRRRAGIFHAERAS